MAESTRVLRSSTKRSPSSPLPKNPTTTKRLRSEPRVSSKNSKVNGILRVSPSTKKVSSKETRKPPTPPITSSKRGKPSVESRSEMKKKISGEIKSILLKAGWTIDLRPRNNRDYLDAVYLPPKPYKGSFWSITKAYNVYLEHMKSSRKLASDPIPENLLSMLNRKTTPGARLKHGSITRKRFLVRRTNEEDDDFVPYPWKRTILSWIIDSGVVSDGGKVHYVGKRKKIMMEGWITRDGIRCGCCSDVVSASEFETHAGSKLSRPYGNIIVEEGGASLLQCQESAWENQVESERKGFLDVDVDGDDPSDDTCLLCGDGGELVCCDGCPSTFHLNCLGLEMLPPDDWHCRSCSCKFCNVACKEDDTTMSSLLSCSHCEMKFHQDCIPNLDYASTGSGLMFCGHSCQTVYMQLQKLLGIQNDLGGGFSWTLIHRVDDESVPLCTIPQITECNSKIAVAFAVMNECFMSTIDKRSGINMIHNIVYNCGANIRRLDFSGFYTFILERGDEIISVASLRIHGTKMAEMPYIGTRDMYRHQGMCRRLLNGIESALGSLKVEKLIIPAISEMTDTWTGSFGFKALEPSHEQEVRSTNLLIFPGIDLFQKPILKIDEAEQDSVAGRTNQI